MEIEELKQQAVTVSQHEITEIKKGVDAVKKQVELLHDALIGNQLSKDGGLIQRIINAESKQLVIELRLEGVEKHEKKEELYLKIIWAFCGAIAAVMTGFLINVLKP